MADASSVRKCTLSLPSPTGTMASGIRYQNGELWVANGTVWSPLGRTTLTVPIQAAADAVDQTIFIADRAYQLVSISEVHTVVGGSSAAAAVNKCTGTQAPSAGTAMTTAGFDLTSTINTPVALTLSATVANTKVATGDRIALDLSGTIGSYAGVVSLVLRPI